MHYVQKDRVCCIFGSDFICVPVRAISAEHWTAIRAGFPWKSTHVLWEGIWVVLVMSRVATVLQYWSLFSGSKMYASSLQTGKCPPSHWYTPACKLVQPFYTTIKCRVVKHNIVWAMCLRLWVSHDVNNCNWIRCLCTCTMTYSGSKIASQSHVDMPKKARWMKVKVTDTNRIWTCIIVGNGAVVLRQLWSMTWLYVSWCCLWR